MGLLARLLVLAVLILPTAASPADVTAGNVATLVPKWTFTSGGVSGGPIVRDGRVYVGSWDGHVYALDAATGTEVWNRAVQGAVPGRVLPLDDGGICYGTINPPGGEVGCLDGATGAVRWQKSVAEPLAGVVWSAPVAANGRLFVGVAGLADQPCSRGRLLALDLATGNELWRFYTVPEKICTTDTATACTTDADCPSAGTCVPGIGGGITATPVVDPTGEWVYMNTVGCYTFPSIGESDSVFKIAAATGDVAWRNRVNDPEQFNTCANDTGIDCGTAADCAAVGGECNKKRVYHDFGFVNGPLRIEVPNGAGGTRVLIVSASKNGTLYALDEATGAEAWTNVVRQTPVTPNFAGYGLFNGAITHVDGRIFAALYQLTPPRICSNDPRKGCRSDANCIGGFCPEEPKHLMAFDATTGKAVWEEEIGHSWSHVGVANGVVYAGTQETEADADASWLYAHDAASGARLATFPLPQVSAARTVVAGDTAYVGFGVGASGGVTALSLCPNGIVDDGETCDGAADAACCTSTCTVATLEQLVCAIDRFGAAPCGDESLPAGLARTATRAVKNVERLVKRAMTLAASGKTERAEKLRERAMKILQTIATKAGKAAAARKESKRITAECRAALDTLVTSRRAMLGGFEL